MCGRYVLSTSTDELVDEFGLEESPPDPAADHNIAPTKDVYAVLRAPARTGTEPVRRLGTLRWGLVPGWAADPASAPAMINARVETVADKPAFRPAFAARRCVLPASGYYEWHGDRRTGRRPYFLRPAGGGLLAMAGIYELWRDASRPDGDPAAWLWSVAILTAQAEGTAARLHDRMPLAVSREGYGAWLDSATDPALVRGLLETPHARLEAHPVSTAVNDVRSNGPALLHSTPDAPAEQPALF